MEPSAILRAGLTAVLCMCLPAVVAGQTTINFDSLSCGTPVIVTTQFAGVGVSPFSSGGSGPRCVAAVIGSSSPPNVLIPEVAPSQIPIAFDFLFPVPFAEIRPLDVGVNGLRLECFSATGGGGSSLGFVDATTHLPFGPFLCWAGWLVWLYGPVMWG